MSEETENKSQQTLILIGNDFDHLRNLGKIIATTNDRVLNCKEEENTFILVPHRLQDLKIENSST